jgi:hypothetical protein
MSMPKTTVHKDDLTLRTKHQVRLSWQVLSVQAEAISETMDKPPDG